MMKIMNYGKVFSRLVNVFAGFLLFSSVSSVAYALATDLRPGASNVALTFDDGPDPRYTEQILDILDEYHIKATFFVVGNNARRYPQLIEEIHRRGHAVANHTMSHAMLTRASAKKLTYEVAETNAVVKEIIGVAPTCLRPPYGKHNKRVDAVANEQDLAVLTWDLNSFDYNRPGAQKLTNWVVKETRPHFVVLMHDGGGNRSQTVAALPHIIKGLQQKGYGFEPICRN